ncbi:alpha/beta fold hydrolase [Roseomonas terrae]|jgi:3-oxoadipate enol-lactonase|uniref:Alpha/beta fold hydrolase n=1 Tax=Neoroseomonas terrae TaxID=424799 RepID=A0ABS5EGD4_9PROT|nr:alpha/beta hydrolase [Neoroseomonas terrae]MBR0650091.1 alpha/beta fold hydrolase [Neoroseomonas terrae]
MLTPTMAHLTSSDGIRLAYRVDDFSDPWRENAMPILMLHAAMGAYRRWYAWLPIIARRFPVISLELRGHGGSEIPPASLPFSLERLVQDARELLDHLGVARAHVVGLSAGGYVGQRLAIEDPQRVATLSLFASTPGLRGTQAAGWPERIGAMGLEAFMRSTATDRFGPDADPALVDWFCRQTSSNDPAYLGRFVTHMASRDWSEDLPRITCPTLIVAPGHEPIGSSNHYEEMAAAIPDSELVVFEGMPHNIGDAAPERSAHEALRFIEERGA